MQLKYSNYVAFSHFHGKAVNNSGLIIAHEVLFVRICLGSDKNNISVFSSVIRKIIQIYKIYRRICFIIKCYCNLVPQIFYICHIHVLV